MKRSRKRGAAEHVRIGSEPGVVLAATLHLPAGRTAAPLPVVMAIPGGGPSGRHSYNVLKARFLEDGLAFLEYDKRGVWESTGQHTDALPVQFKDAAVVVEFLRTRPDIDSDRIALIGLCHGAMIGPALAVSEPGVAAVVMLSGPVGAGPALFIQQMRAALVDAGTGDPVLGRLLDDTRSLFEARAGGAGAAAVAACQEALILSFRSAGYSPSDARRAMFWIDTPESLSIWMARPDRTLASVRVPVLALYGALDTLVPPAFNAPAAEAALADNPDALVLEMPGLNHLFQHAKTGSKQEMIELGTPNCAPEMVSLVGDWIRDRLYPAAAPRKRARASRNSVPQPVPS